MIDAIQRRLREAQFFHRHVVSAPPGLISSEWLPPVDPHQGGRAAPDLSLASLSASIKQALTAWLADAQNGITDFFAKNLYAQNVTADTGTFRQLTTGSLTASNTISAHTLLGDELCAGTVCVNQQQLAVLLSQMGAPTPPISVPRPPAVPRPSALS